MPNEGIPEEEVHTALKEKRELFSKCVEVGENRSVSVVEMPGGNILITGNTVDDPHGDTPVVTARSLYFSQEAAMGLCSILNKWKAVQDREIHVDLKIDQKLDELQPESRPIELRSPPFAVFKTYRPEDYELVVEVSSNGMPFKEHWNITFNEFKGGNCNIPTKIALGWRKDEPNAPDL